MVRRVWLQTHRFFALYAMAAAIFASVFLCACSESDVNRGNAALRIGDFDRAVKNFSRALDENPAHRDARYGLALAYYAIAEDRERLKESSQEIWERAVNEFRILSRLDSSGSVDAVYSTSLFYLARATLMENRKANVLPLLNQSIQLDSLNYFSLNLKGLILEQKGLLEDAKNIFIYIVTREPKFASAYVNLGNLYWSEGDVESAWDIWSMGHNAIPMDRTLAHWTLVAEDSLKAMVDAGRL